MTNPMTTVIRRAEGCLEEVIGRDGDRRAAGQGDGFIGDLEQHGIGGRWNQVGHEDGGDPAKASRQAGNRVPPDGQEGRRASGIGVGSPASEATLESTPMKTIR